MSKNKIQNNVINLSAPLNTYGLLLEALCEYAGYTVSKFIHNLGSQKRKYHYPRVILAHYLYNGKKNLNETEVGERLGGKHRTSVIHLLKVCNNLVETEDPEFMGYVDAVSHIYSPKPQKEVITEKEYLKAKRCGDVNIS